MPSFLSTVYLLSLLIYYLGNFVGRQLRAVSGLSHARSSFDCPVCCLYLWPCRCRAVPQRRPWWWSSRSGSWSRWWTTWWSSGAAPRPSPASTWPTSGLTTAFRSTTTRSTRPTTGSASPASSRSGTSRSRSTARTAVSRGLLSERSPPRPGWGSRGRLKRPAVCKLSNWTPRQGGWSGRTSLIMAVTSACTGLRPWPIGTKAGSSLKRVSQTGKVVGCAGWSWVAGAGSWSWVTGAGAGSWVAGCAGW